MPRIVRRFGWFAVVLSIALWVAGSAAGQPSPPAGRTMTIGSKNFTESRLLGELMAQLIEARTDITVDRRVNLGGTTVVFTALQSGEIDLYPEYTGTAWSILLKIPETVRDPLQTYLRVARDFSRQHDLVWLQPLGFNNGYALAMDKTKADTLGIRTISDLTRHNDDLRVGFTHEFLNREDGYPGLDQTYGLKLGNLRGVEHGLAYEALAKDRLDVVDTYTTDGKLLRYDLRLLQDDKRFFPPYQCAPVVRADTLETHPQLRDILDDLAFRIDDETMRRLNYQVEEGGSFETVAREFLLDHNLLDAPLDRPTGLGQRNSGFFAFVWSRRAETARLMGEHLRLTALAMLLAIIIAVPVGVLLTRRPTVAPLVLGGAGIIQTIPSLALLAFMIPLPGLGLGTRSAVAALLLYALLPIVRNTYTGIKEVDADLVEAARAMGLKDHQILTKVELPLATRTIMAGIRTSTVISVGVATLAAFIGAGGLGDPILTGLQLNDINLILSGAVPAAVLALLVDFALGLAERVLVPKGIG